jgi:hypothetical protein
VDSPRHNPDLRVDVALVHYPVLNRRQETIGSALTNLDVHDIARAAKTYGVSTYWVVTPFAEQQRLAAEIIGHWTNGYGGEANPDRSHALSMITICSSVAEAVDGSTRNFGARPLVVATCARCRDKTLDYGAVRERVWAGDPVLVLLGTAWGLAPDVLTGADGVLPPLVGPAGPGAFNHLSVRSAAAIILDRLLAPRNER